MYKPWRRCDFLWCLFPFTRAKKLDMQTVYRTCPSYATYTRSRHLISFCFPTHVCGWLVLLFFPRWRFFLFLVVFTDDWPFSFPQKLPLVFSPVLLLKILVALLFALYTTTVWK